ncbi:MAG: glycosyltransferase [Elusimicrobiota bacterium]|nr:glycosyltransferase [Endomicrobiia bacterium]MDW8166437.1 glycosyltransferase [Elusimicrobiota bacterium]
MNYIVLLAYNESKNIKELLQTIRDVLTKNDIISKIVVVDDGSEDDTLEILKLLKKDFDNLVILSHYKNLGVAAAFRTGLTYVSKVAVDTDNIITMECDMTNDPCLLPEIVKQLQKGYDIVVASRNIKGGGYLGFPLKRFIISKIANLLFSLLFPTKGMTDYTIFYRGYKAKLIKNLVDKYGEDFITTEGFSSNFEIFLRCRKWTDKICSIPLVYRYYLKKSKSKMRILKNLIEYIFLILDYLREKK